jgi:hypothetical protein
MTFLRCELTINISGGKPYIKISNVHYDLRQEDLEVSGKTDLNNEVLTILKGTACKDW